LIKYRFGRVLSRCLLGLCIISWGPWRSAAFALNPAKAITQYGHDVWQTEDGLPHNSVGAILQTRDGYLWLGTKDGLARFDGVRFSIFNTRNTQALKNNNILALYEARDGSLWIGTFGGGVSRLKDGNFETYSTDQGLTHTVVWAICEDRHGNVWLGTGGGGLNVWKDGKIRAFTTNDGLSNDFVWSILEDRKGSLWIGTNAGLNRLVEGEFATYGSGEGLSNEIVRSIIEDTRDGSLWIGTNGGISRFKDGRFTNYRAELGVSNALVRAIAQDDQGALWIGTSFGGVNRFYDGRFSAYTAKDGLSDNAVRCLYQGREGSLWIGTNGGGLNRLKDGRVTPFTTKEGLSNDVVFSLLQDGPGNLWIGTGGGGLNLFKNGRFSHITASSGLSSDVVAALYEDSDGALWIGTYGGGLNRLKNGRLTHYGTKDGLSDDNVISICGTSDGSLWVGTNGGGLNRLYQGKFTAYDGQHGLAGNIISSLHQDGAGGLWVGTYGAGLYHLKDGQLTRYTKRQGLADDVVWGVYLDARGELWVATGDGLSRLKNGKITAYTSREGLWDDRLYQILEDNSGGLWLSSSNGIFRITRKDVDDFDKRVTHSISCQAYGTADGMPTNECNGGSPAGWKTRDGKLWFPTGKGVVMIDPEAIKINPLPPTVIIEAVKIDDKSINAQKYADVPPGRGELTFEFTALSFLAPEKVRFKYKLEGFDPDWRVATGLREAHYTNIGPGGYAFRVMGCNNDGVWNQTPASFKFRLQPHFYQTYWFFGLCGMAAVVLGAGAYKLRVRQMTNRERELMRVVEERTRQLEQANQRLEHLSSVDGLTGIANRRRFQDVLELEWGRARRGAYPISVAMVDIDHFKLYNDTYGHQSGDDCLKRVAATLASVLNRPGDLVARYGGEEFVVVLPETNRQGAVLMAESLRKKIEDLHIANAQAPSGRFLTASVGVATCIPSPEDASPLHLLIAADRALYRAKGEGRNRTEEGADLESMIFHESDGLSS